MYSKVFIPYRGYFSSPFSRWQGSLQSEHPVELVASTAKKWLAARSNQVDLKAVLFTFLLREQKGEKESPFALSATLR